MPKKSKLEEKLAEQIADARLPTPEREYRFHETRMWRIDFAWPSYNLLVEAEGGVFSRGRHTRGVGFIADAEKYNTATLMGYRVLRFPGVMIYDGTAIAFIKQALERVGSEREKLCECGKRKCE